MRDAWPLLAFTSAAGRWTPRVRRALYGGGLQHAQALARPGALTPPQHARAAATAAATQAPLSAAQLATTEPTPGPLTGPEFDALLQALEPPRRGDAVVVAVSGGPDSLALLALMSQWCRHQGVLPLSVTVDHGLRAESAAEAAGVQAFAEGRLGIPHITYRLDWETSGSSDGGASTSEVSSSSAATATEATAVGMRLPRKSQLQTVARTRRYAALTDVARAVGASQIFTGHTLNDQLETMLYRFSRSSGVVGLAGMRGRTLLPCGTAALLRPLLTVPKQRLLATCEQQGLLPVHDPSNNNPVFDRVRVRRAIAGYNAAEAAVDAPTPPPASLPLPFDLLEHASRVLAGTASDIQTEVSALIAQCCRIHSTDGYVMLWPHRLLGAGSSGGGGDASQRAELLAKLALARLLTACSGRDLPVSSSSVEEALAFMQRLTRTAALPRAERAQLMPKGSWPSLATGQCLLKVMLTAEGKPLCQPQTPPPLLAEADPAASNGKEGKAGKKKAPSLPPLTGDDPWQALLASEGISGAVVPGASQAGAGGSAQATPNDDGVPPDALQVLVLRETASLHRRKASNATAATAAGHTANWRAAESLLLTRPSNKEGSSSSSSSTLPSRGVALPTGLPVVWDNLFQLTATWRPVPANSSSAGGRPKQGGAKAKSAVAASPGGAEAALHPSAPGALEGLTSSASSRSSSIGLAAVRLSTDEWEYLSFLYPDLQPALKAFKETCPSEALLGLPVGVLVDETGVPIPVARLGKADSGSSSSPSIPLPTLADVRAAVAASAAPSAAAATAAAPPPPPVPAPRSPSQATPHPPRQLILGLKALDEKARGLMRVAAEEATATATATAAAAAAAKRELTAPTHGLSSAVSDRETYQLLAPPLAREAVETLLDEALVLLQSCASTAAAPSAAAPAAAPPPVAPAAPSPAPPPALPPPALSMSRTELPHITRLRMYNQVLESLQAQGVLSAKQRSGETRGSKDAKSSKGSGSGGGVPAAQAGTEAQPRACLFARPWWQPTRRALPAWAETTAAAEEIAQRGGGKGVKDSKATPPLQMASLQSYLRAVAGRHAATAAAAAGVAGANATAAPVSANGVYWSRPVVLKAASLWENVDKQVVEAVVAVPHLRFAVWPELTLECKPLLAATAPGDSSLGITTP